MVLERATDFVRALRRYATDGIYKEENFGEIPGAALAEIIAGTEHPKLQRDLDEGRREVVQEGFSGTQLSKTLVIAAKVSVGTLLAASAGYGVYRGVKAIRRRKKSASSY